MSVAHTELQCKTVPGVGRKLFWSVRVRDLSSGAVEVTSG